MDFDLANVERSALKVRSLVIEYAHGAAREFAPMAIATILWYQQP
jgi:hypothetical protein